MFSSTKPIPLLQLATGCCQIIRSFRTPVVVELKVGPFESKYAGKMDFYLNLLNEKERVPDDRPSIGIIICAEKDNLEVEFALKTKTNPIGVAEYPLQPRLPAELKGKLPSPKQLSNALRGELDAVAEVQAKDDFGKTAPIYGKERGLGAVNDESIWVVDETLTSGSTLQ